jgi:very-short-patch-repair endonuclease
MSDERTRKGRVRGSSTELISSARTLRREMTPAERALWEHLRAHHGGGLRFRRQYVVGQFVLDFACASLKLGIELDGSVHDGHEAQDAARSEWLLQYGWTILRFPNDAVLTSIESVLRNISDAADMRSKVRDFPR